MAAKKRRAKKSAKRSAKRTTTKRHAKHGAKRRANGHGHVPLKVLERRLSKLEKVVAARRKNPSRWK